MSEVIEKVWGSEEILVNNELYCLKYLRVRRGSASSLHRHDKKDETFIVKRGEIRLETVTGMSKSTQLLTRGESERIHPRTWHRFSSPTCDSTVIEVSTHHDDEDVSRAESSRPPRRKR